MRGWFHFQARSSGRSSPWAGLLLVMGTLLSGSAVAQAESVYSSGLFQLGDGLLPPGAASANILEDAVQAGPDWGSLFGADGKTRYQNLYGGDWAIFTADDVSMGTAMESTALMADGRVANGTAAADHDIGNAYVYSTSDALGNLVLYMGAERLGDGDSYLEFEFDQAVVRLGHGGFGRNEPWELVGDRTVGDVRVRVDFAGGAVSSVSASRWAGGAWAPVQSLAGFGCNAEESLCLESNLTGIEGGPWKNHDTLGDPEVISAHRFIEVGLNVGALTGANPGFSTVCLRTPEDVDFAYFNGGN